MSSEVSSLKSIQLRGRSCSPELHGEGELMADTGPGNQDKPSSFQVLPCWIPKAENALTLMHVSFTARFLCVSQSHIEWWTRDHDPVLPYS